MKRIALDGTVADVQPDITWQPDIPTGRTVVWAGRLWDGVASGYQENMDVVIDGNTITAVEPHRQRAADERVVNASRKTVIPGLIDSRARLSEAAGERLGRLLLSYGITSVREWGDDPYGTLERREAWSSDRRHGPRVFSTVMVLPGGTDAWEKRVVFEMERARHLGYDVAAKDPRLVDHARAENQLKPMTIGMRRVDRATEAATRPGMTLIPSLALDGGLAAMALRHPAIMSNPQYLALHTDYEVAALTRWLDKQRASQKELERTVMASQNSLHALVARGGLVVLGSGSPGVPYGLGFLTECMLAQGSGLSALQVLQLATSGAAASIGVDDQLGTLSTGKLADLVIIDGDPLNSTSDLAKVAGVVANGHYFIIDELLRN
jgi:imidazolonepropionase-like amidohydrolase